MYILTLKGKETEGAYAPSIGTDNILYLFEEEEDAERHCGLLAADDYPELIPVEVDDETAIDVCQRNGYSYCIVTPEDIVIPPSELDD
jgi:hypothetical protein|tara:strand:- start:3892 stop:4155 length:264 start_codon:yes stop_codon:yes gene_type:complete